jgi:hypothetical protein
MLDRLAAGTKNADIAEEFDLSPQAGSGRPYRVGPRNCRSLPGEA